jgi:NAD(P)-dependent dehydrogenase (short-subunit alcohol dehydrogenase family)
MHLKKISRRLALGRRIAIGMGIGMGASAGLLTAGVLALRKRSIDLTNQVVLITGGSRGLGLAVAQEFGKRGCRLAICARDEEELNRARLQLEAEGREVLTVTCDVSDPSSVKGTLAAVRARYGRIDILVNNAGEIRVAPLGNLTAADFEQALSVMFWGMVHSTLEVLPLFREQGGGRIVNVTSIGGKVSTPHLLAYSCAKAAAIAFSEGLRNEAAREGIHVTTVVPGLMRTGSNVNAIFKGKYEDESGWFGVAAGLPFLSIPASRAARGIVCAVRRGTSETILGIPAVVLAKAYALCPGTMSRILTLVNGLLPSPTPGASAEESGLHLEPRHGSVYHFLTTLNRRAGRRLNQPA